MRNCLRSTRLVRHGSCDWCSLGFNLAAVMLLGKDDVIADVVPAYVTDATFEYGIDADRYDDREIIKTNLVESYEQLMEFRTKTSARSILI